MKTGNVATKTNSGAPKTGQGWEPIQPACFVFAKYRYRTKEPGHVLFNYSDLLLLESKHQTNAQWFYGRSITTGQSGLIPRQYTTYDSFEKPQEEEKKPFSSEIDEVNQVLRTWALQMSNYCLAHDASRFIALQQRAARLLALRWALVASVERHEPTIIPSFTLVSDDTSSSSSASSSQSSETTVAEEKPHYLNEDELKVLTVKINEEIDSVVSLMGLDMNVHVTDKNDRVRATLLNTGPNKLLSLFEEHSHEGTSAEDAVIDRLIAEGGPKHHRRRTTLLRRPFDSSGLDGSSNGSESPGTPTLPSGSSGSLTSSGINMSTSSSLTSSSAGGNDDHLHGVTFQITVQMVMILVDVGSEFEVRFSLFSTKNNDFITEECCVKYGTDMKPLDGKQDCRVVFRDVENIDLAADNSVYLVMRVIRLGVVDPKSRATPDHPFRRPFGAGCAKLTAESCEHGECELRVDMHCCPDSVFGVLPQTLIGISEGTTPASTMRDQDIRNHPRSKGIIMKAQFFRSDFESTISTNPVLRDSKVMMTLRTPTVVMPSMKRNDFYVVLCDGDLNEKNVELLVSVRSNSNLQEPLKCIVEQDGSLSQFHRSIVLTTSSPKWHETIKLRLSEAQLLTSHLLVECQHISSDGKVNKPHCAGFFYFGKNSAENNTRIVVPNQKYKISMFKPHVNKAGEEVPYLDDPERKSIKSFINISIASASTEFSQNETLNDLFNGISGPDMIPEVLRRLTFMEPQDIVKYLGKVFSALFGIIDMFREDNKLTSDVYDVIVRLLTKFSDNHWSWNFRPALDSTINQLQGMTHYSAILNLMHQALAISENDSSSNIQHAIESMKVLDYLWMIIQRSRETSLPVQQAETEGENAFQNTVEQFLSSLRRVLLSQSQKVLSAKVSVLKHLPTILQGIISFIDEKMVCDEIINFFSIADSLERNGKMNESKLHFYWSIAKSPLIDNLGTRKALMPHLVHYTWHHMLYDLKIISGRKEKFRAEDRLIAIRESRRCVGIFGTLADKIVMSQETSVAERNEDLVLLLKALPLITKFYSFVFGDTCSNSIQRTRITAQDMKTADIRSVMLVTQSLIHMTPSYVWEEFMEKTIKDEDSRVSFLLTLFEMMQRSVESPLPKQWAELVGFQYSSILHFVHLLSCSKEFCQRISHFASTKEPKADDDVAARGSYSLLKTMAEDMMSLCCEFILSRQLSRSVLSVTVLEQYGDMRLPMCTIMRKLWLLLGEKRLLLESVLLRFIRMNGPTMSGVPQIQKTALTLFAEFCADGCKTPELLERTRVALLEVFDLATEEAGMCDTCLGLLSRLRDSASKEVLPMLEAAEQLINSKQKLEEARTEYEAKDKTIKDTNEPNKVEEKGAVLDRMINVLHDIYDLLCDVPGSESLRNHYLELISDMLKDRKKNDLGLALKKLCKSYSWSDTSFVEPCYAINETPSQGQLSTQPAWKTKEQVCIAAANALKAGNLQDDALDILEDVRKFQSEEEFDYLGVAKTLRMEAENAMDLTKGDRIPREYYHVGFYGSDLPPEIKNKDFIYPARPLEKLLDFQERIQIAYPNSEVLKKTDASADEYTTPGLKLLITNAVVCSDKEIDAVVGAATPEGEAVMVDRPAPGSVFMYSKPWRKKKLEKGENEFRGLYIQKQYFITSDPCPNTRVRTEIVKRREVLITPIENACSMVCDKNDELRALIKKYDDAAPGTGPSVQPLAMALNGCIMAAVNGGLAMYQEAFLNEAFRLEEPEQAVHQETLLAGINDQMTILEQGLQTFERHCTPDMADLMGLLKEMFEKMRKTWAEQSAKGSSPPPVSLNVPVAASDITSAIVSAAQQDADGQIVQVQSPSSPVSLTVPFSASDITAGVVTAAQQDAEGQIVQMQSDLKALVQQQKDLQQAQNQILQLQQQYLQSGQIPPPAMDQQPQQEIPPPPADQQHQQIPPPPVDQQYQQIPPPPVTDSDFIPPPTCAPPPQ